MTMLNLFPSGFDAGALAPFNAFHLSLGSDATLAFTYLANFFGACDLSSASFPENSGFAARFVHS